LDRKRKAVRTPSFAAEKNNHRSRAAEALLFYLPPALPYWDIAAPKIGADVTRGQFPEDALDDVFPLIK
jgi:hypothetical protein